MHRLILTAVLVLLSVGCGDAPTEEAHTRADGIRDGFVDTNGTRLYFKSLGSGDPIVVRGTGLSSGPVDSASITIDNFVADIEGIREAFGLERINLFGHSWGGALAMHYAVRHADRLNSLILASSSATHESSRDMRAEIQARRPADDTALLDSIAQSEEFQAEDPASIARFWQVYFRVYFANPAYADSMDLVFTDNTIAHSNTVAGLVMRSAGAFDLHEQLGSIEVPTLILHGDSDPMPLSYAERINASLPNSELVVLNDSGHWIFVDAMDQITEHVLAFLRRAQGA